MYHTRSGSETKDLANLVFPTCDSPLSTRNLYLPRALSYCWFHSSTIATVRNGLSRLRWASSSFFCNASLSAAKRAASTYLSCFRFISHRTTVFVEVSFPSLTGARRNRRCCSTLTLQTDGKCRPALPLAGAGTAGSGNSRKEIIWSAYTIRCVGDKNKQPRRKHSNGRHGLDATRHCIPETTHDFHS